MPQDWLPVIALSISSQLIGQGLLVYAMGYVSPVVVGLCFLTQPIASARDRLDRVSASGCAAGDALGALLICAALVLIRLPARKLAASPAAAH